MVPEARVAAERSIEETHDEALEAALAYGWIDGQARPGDETYWLQDATRPETRAGRIARFVEMPARGEKIYG
jgi:hypothetical protein